MPITDLLEENARKFGSDVALVEVNPQVQETRRVLWKDYDLIQPTSSFWYRREITWHVFDEKANRFAQLLMSRGVKKGDKVAILLMNCLEWLPIYFGVLKTGALAVPMNFRYSAEEIEYCLDLAEADVLVFGPEFIGRIETIAESISKKRILFYVGGDCPSFAEDYDKLTSNCASISPGVPLTDEDDAAIYFSSGTTGFPKAILHNHESLMHACKVEQNHHHQTKDDVFLCIPPLYHTGAKMHWFGSLLTGGRAVLLKGVNPETILETISREKCTIVWLLVPWALDILEALDNGSVHLENYELSQWRLMHIGAQPVPQGEVGELAVKGPGVMKCYYNNPEATAEVLHDGWLYTGDMARQDEDGFYFLVDRKKDVVISGGENIYPVEIENFMSKFDKIKDVAVIGLPDKRLGEIATAIVELKQGVTCTEAEINEFCMGMPRYKRPRKIIFASVPRNATGKIEKPKLRKMYCGDYLIEKENQG